MILPYLTWIVYKSFANFIDRYLKSACAFSQLYHWETPKKCFVVIKKYGYLSGMDENQLEYHSLLFKAGVLWKLAFKMNKTKEITAGAFSLANLTRGSRGSDPNFKNKSHIVLMELCDNVTNDKLLHYLIGLPWCSIEFTCKLIINLAI